MRTWTLDNNCLFLAAALLVCFQANAANPAPPATSVGFNQLTIAGEECERRATLALTAEGFPHLRPPPAPTTGRRAFIPPTFFANPVRMVIVGQRYLSPVMLQTATCRTASARTSRNECLGPSHPEVVVDPPSSALGAG